MGKMLKEAQGLCTSASEIGKMEKGWEEC